MNEYIVSYKVFKISINTEPESITSERRPLLTSQTAIRKAQNRLSRKRYDLYEANA